MSSLEPNATTSSLMACHSLRRFLSTPSTRVPVSSMRKTGRKTLWWEDYETGWRLQLLRQWQPLILQWKRHCYIICPEKKKPRGINICQYGQERTGQSTRYGNGRFFWDTEGTLRTEANKRPNQENGNPDHLLRHPYCQCSTIGKENCKSGTLPGCLVVCKV